MATESDLRDLLRDPESEGRAAIDLDAVLSRARRRRRPKVVVAQALGSVAAVGVLVTGVAVTLPQQTPASVMVADELAGGAENWSVPGSADESALRMLTEVCGEPFAEMSTSSLAASIDPAATDGTVTALSLPVTVTNPSAVPVAGTASIPLIVITLEGVVVGHASPIESIGLPVALEPGARTTLDAAVEPYACDPADPAAPIARLPLLPPGEYEMRAVVQFARDDVLETIVGPPTALVIR